MKNKFKLLKKTSKSVDNEEKYLASPKNRKPMN